MSHCESNLPTCHQRFTLMPKPPHYTNTTVTFCSPLIIYVSLPNITHMWCHRKLSSSRWFITTLSFVFFRCLMGHTLPSRGTPLLDKVEKLSQTAIHHDSNTHMDTFVDHSDIFYPEFSFHMKHMGYFSPTMNSYMVSLKYDFEEFRSKHWVYTDTSADISNETPVFFNVDSELNFYMNKLLIMV